MEPPLLTSLQAHFPSPASIIDERVLMHNGAVPWCPLIEKRGQEGDKRMVRPESCLLQRTSKRSEQDTWETQRNWWIKAENPVQNWFRAKLYAIGAFFYVNDSSDRVRNSARRTEIKAFVLKQPKPFRNPGDLLITFTGVNELFEKRNLFKESFWNYDFLQNKELVEK